MEGVPPLGENVFFFFLNHWTDYIRINGSEMYCSPNLKTILEYFWLVYNEKLTYGILILTWQMQIVIFRQTKFHCSCCVDIRAWFNSVFLFLYGDRIRRQIGFKETHYLLSLSEYKGQTLVLSQRKQLSSSAFVFHSEREALCLANRYLSVNQLLH